MMLMMQSREVMDSRFFLCYGLGKLKCGKIKFCIFSDSFIVVVQKLFSRSFVRGR